MEPDNIYTLAKIYIFTLINYACTSNIFSLVIANILLVTSLLVNIGFSPDVINNLMFVCHVLYIVLLINIVHDILSIVFSTLFYFGFTNLVIVLYFISVILMSNIITSFQSKILDLSNRYSIVNRIVTALNYYYNAYIVAYRVGEIIISALTVCFATTYSYSKSVLIKIFMLQTEYAANKQTEKYIDNLDIAYGTTRRYFMMKVLSNKIKEVNKILSSNKLDINFPDNQDIGMEEDFMDDLDDVDITDAPVVTKEQLEQDELAQKEEQRKALKEKIRSKKQSRRNGNVPSVPNKNVMADPMFKNMVANMANNDDLLKMLGGKGKLDNSDMKQVKNMLQSLTK